MEIIYRHDGNEYIYTARSCMTLPAHLVNVSRFGGISLDQMETVYLLISSF